MAHAYYVESEQEQGIEQVRSFAEKELLMEGKANPDIIVLRYTVCSVDNARKVLTYAYQSGVSGQKLIVLATERLFHEAQNALLKVFEEPPVGTTLVLVIPSLGILLPTLRSRLIEIPGNASSDTRISDMAESFMQASQSEREKIVKKLLDRSKSDKESEKQLARVEVQHLIAGITRMVHQSWRKKATKEQELLLRELEVFTPLLYQPSAPVKLILEHLLLTVPKK